MTKLKRSNIGFVVNGTIAGHPFISKRGYPHGAAVVAVPPTQRNISTIEGRKLKASRPAIEAANMKGAV